jgi:hypothetical protein
MMESPLASPSYPVSQKSSRISEGGNRQLANGSRGVAVGGGIGWVAINLSMFRGSCMNGDLVVKIIKKGDKSR